jgi:hypothetical protein
MFIQKYECGNAQQYNYLPYISFMVNLAEKLSTAWRLTRCFICLYCVVFLFYDCVHPSYAEVGWWTLVTFITLMKTLEFNDEAPFIEQRGERARGYEDSHG